MVMSDPFRMKMGESGSREKGGEGAGTIDPNRRVCQRGATNRRTVSTSQKDGCEF